jgi:DNA-binding winged helix-turn-helix (wHTH) protein
MGRRKIYSFSASVIIVFLTWIVFTKTDKKDDFTAVTKIALREVGNQVLLYNQDSTSLILPIVKLEGSKYELSFQNEFLLKPGALVDIVEKSFLVSALPNFYLVELIQCSDQQVAYSYEMKGDRENSVIPCFGRVLPQGCYTLQVRFTEGMASELNKKALFFAPAVVSLILLAFSFKKTNQTIKKDQAKEDYFVLGSFKFYPEQNKLLNGTTTISLSKKECELLTIFINNPNEVIRRDELMKRVWEDNGVFVGRSLDTFISRLRKILKSDSTIQLTNVHSVGYKLEIKD